jgi:hypothetical protein
MWPSENVASRLYDVANCGLIAGLVVGFVSTALVVWMGNVKEGYLRQSLAEVNRQASDANERAKALDLEAAALEFANLSLQKELLKQGPRENLIVGETRHTLVGVLKSFAGQKIDVRHSASTPTVNGEIVSSLPIGEDALGLASSLIGVLKDAGWRLPGFPLPSRSLGYGVRVEILPNASPATRNAAHMLVEALHKVPLVVSGPHLVPENLAKRIGTEVQEPPFDENTIILVVMTHPN